MIRLIAGLITTTFIIGIAQAQTPLSSTDIERRLLHSRAVEAFIWGLPAVNTDLMRQQMLTKTACEVGQVIYWGRPLDWRNQTLTPNPDTLYFMVFFDTRDGPIVLDLPAANASNSFNANIVTMWQMPLEDAGLLGIDKGAGVKFVVLPPGFTGSRPTGYVPLQPDTYSGYMVLRSNLIGNGDAEVNASIAYGKRMKIYPLAQASSPPSTIFTDVKDIVFDSTIRYDASFFDNLHRIVHDEPWIDRDRAMIDQLRTLGIEKGKSFAPSEQTRAVLNAAATEAGAWLEARYDAGMTPFFSEASRWTFPAPQTVIKAYADNLADINAYPVDDRGLSYSYAYIGIKRLGAGQFYAISIRDKDGDPFDGARTYRLKVPADVPVDQYWSVTAYDRQTHALIKHVARASRSSRIPDLQKNSDGSVDLYLGPAAPVGKDANWIPTDPSRKFELMARFYAPKKEFFEKTWKLPDVEKLELTVGSGAKP